MTTVAVEAVRAFRQAKSAAVAGIVTVFNTRRGYGPQPGLLR